MIVVDMSINSSTIISIIIDMIISSAVLLISLSLLLLLSLRLGSRHKGEVWVAILAQRHVSNTASFVFYSITCLIRLSEFAALLTTVEEQVC